MQSDSASQSIRAFIVDRFPRARTIDDEASLLTNGVLDSLGILDVVAFLEREFQVVLDDDDLVPENFESVKSIARFKGVHKLWVITNESNAAAMALYRSVGGVRVAGDDVVFTIDNPDGDVGGFGQR